MKILCSRRDEIIKQRDEYDEDYRHRMDAYDAQYSKYDRATNDIAQNIKSQITAGLSKFNLEFDVRVYATYSRKYDNSVYEVNISCNEGNKFSAGSALSWTYTVRVDNREVIAETNSWSGLKATTREQLNSLHETLSALEYLNSVDWVSLLNDKYPRYKDYITEPYPNKSDRPNFEQQLLEAEIEDAIGKRILFKGKSERGADVWYMFVAETPKQYKVVMIYDAYLKDKDINSLIEENENWVIRISKDKIFKLINQPIETMEA